MTDPKIKIKELVKKLCSPDNTGNPKVNEALSLEIFWFLQAHPMFAFDWVPFPAESNAGSDNKSSIPFVYLMNQGMVSSEKLLEFMKACPKEPKDEPPLVARTEPKGRSIGGLHPALVEVIFPPIADDSKVMQQTLLMNALVLTILHIKHSAKFSVKVPSVRYVNYWLRALHKGLSNIGNDPKMIHFHLEIADSTVFIFNSEAHSGGRRGRFNSVNIPNLSKPSVGSLLQHINYSWVHHISLGQANGPTFSSMAFSGKQNTPGLQAQHLHQYASWRRRLNSYRRDHAVPPAVKASATESIFKLLQHAPSLKELYITCDADIDLVVIAKGLKTHKTLTTFQWDSLRGATSREVSALGACLRDHNTALTVLDCFSGEATPPQIQHFTTLNKAGRCKMRQLGCAYADILISAKNDRSSYKGLPGENINVLYGLLSEAPGNWSLIAVQNHENGKVRRGRKRGISTRIQPSRYVKKKTRK
ncbi:expressed unknown protein [Seminavis robusta]|uniref:Uncharacterized protein n=1 Tax=Seminavis robusta TaxID=568900 RepID=A0A9N8DE67_9STRA|nr:expressed unknown protein [Seminavis robusta]|eukprot:Sro101_g051470.1 n/a (475) ;mRNA; r:19704-21128